MLADHAIGSQFICINLANANNMVLSLWRDPHVPGDSITAICDTFTTAIELFLAGSDLFMEARRSSIA